jgi:ATP-binding cassette subfamily B protein RaxB
MAARATAVDLAARLMVPSILNLSGRRRLPLIRQAEAAECGLACVAMIAGYHGLELDLPTMRRRFSLSMKGITLRTMIDVAAGVGLTSRPIRCDPEELEQVRTPAILHWDTNHFVVLQRVGQGSILLHDPGAGVRAMNAEEVARRFTGVALELEPAPAFRPKRDKNPLRLGSLLRLGPDTWRGLLQAALLSVLMEILFLTAPFYTQLVIDHAILKGDGKLLTVLAFAFSAILLLRTLTGVLRGLTVQFVSSLISFEMKGRVFNHLIRLPLDWFHKRQIGDVQSRFWAIREVQNFVAKGAITGILDGAFGMLVLVILFLYSPALTAVVLSSVLLHAVLRIGSLQLMRRFAGDVIVADAREQTRLLETLRAAQTIKSAGAETIREAQQRNAIAASANATIRAGNITIVQGSAEQALNGITDILVVFIGAKAILDGQLTVGMLMAFVVYQGQFTRRSISLVEQLIAWSMLDLHLERLSDVALSNKEARIDGGGFEGTLEGAIRCRHLVFRYAFGEAPVISGLNLNVQPGESVAIVGPSGCGKSTLVKLLTGLYVPTAGEILIDERPLSHWSPRSLRSQISFVSQDDQLLSGSISENIALFAEDIDMDLVRDAARAACVDDEIMAMPMAYESLVGDMGSSFSGGQKQRILIARALYRRPRILILDEGTAHVDLKTERAINEALSRLPITRLLIAHRPETVATADRVINLGP